MKSLLYPSIITALLVAGCSSLDRPNHPPDLPLRYHNARYDFTFFLPVSWRGYSVLVQRWDGGGKWHGPIIVLRHPHWKAYDPYQDIPIMVFTPSQWEACGQNGGFFPYAGGVIGEMWHNRKFVFGLYTRYNADDDVKGWKEAADILERNMTANDTPQLHPR